MYPRSVFSDFILVVHTHSARQMAFLAHSLYRAARDADAAARNRRALSVERRGADDWVMVDMGHVMVHLFNGQRGELKWGLEYHEVEKMRVEELKGDAKVLEGVGKRREGEGARGMVGVGLLGGMEERRRGEGEPHPVEENIERQFGDLRVPVERFDEVRDYPHGEGSAGGGEVSVLQEVREAEGGGGGEVSG